MQNLKRKENHEPSERHEKFVEALREMQRAMEGEAERSGLDTEEKIVAYIKEVRHELVY